MYVSAAGHTKEHKTGPTVITCLKLLMSELPSIDQQKRILLLFVDLIESHKKNGHGEGNLLIYA